MLDFSNITEGLLVTVLGMLVVFAVLIVIAGVLALTAKLIMSGEAGEKSENIPVPQPVAVKPAPQPVVVPTAGAQDLELIAVITAAISMETGKSVDQLVVRSIRRVKSWK